VKLFRFDGKRSICHLVRSQLEVELWFLDMDRRVKWSRRGRERGRREGARSGAVCRFRDWERSFDDM
jgi:hypothetical protein